MPKQAYEKVHGNWDWEYKPITLLPYCKKETEFGKIREYRKVRHMWFGFIPVTYWVDKRDIVFYDMPTTEYYNCTWDDEE